jgi:hypothetical protein
MYREDGFFVAPFGIDGQQEGCEFVERQRLSVKWLKICGEHLDRHGASFNEPWSGTLAQIHTKFTSAQGVALVTFQVGGRVAASLVLATGASLQAEAQTMQMFVESLRRSAIVQSASADAKPFEAVLSIRERPVMIVVPWPDEAVSEEDHALVRELALHMAGAFLSGPACPSGGGVVPSIKRPAGSR